MLGGHETTSKAVGNLSLTGLLFNVVLTSPLGDPWTLGVGQAP